MKVQKKILSILLTLALGIIFFISCKKSYEKSATDTTSLKSSVSKWYSQVDIYFSAKERRAADSIVKRLDYSKAKKIKVENETFLFVIRIFDDNKLESSYIGFIEKNNVYQTLGLIKLSGAEEKKQIDIIENFIIRYKLKNGESLQVNSLNNLPQKKFEGLPNGKVQFYEAKPIKGSDAKLFTGKKFPRSVLNKVAPDCIDWYWVTYDEDTGIIYSIEYLYTECTDGGGGGTGNTGATSQKADDNHISCESFSFTRGGSTDAQEAGIKNITFDVGSGDFSTTISRNLAGPFYISVPYLKYGTTLVSSREAAARTADALDRAGTELIKKYRDLNYTIAQFMEISDSRLQNELKALWYKELAKEFPGSNIGVFVGAPTFGTTITNNAIINSPWQILWNRMSGSGCW